MSHFTVAVIGDDPEGQLEPFSESSPHPPGDTKMDYYEILEGYHPEPLWMYVLAVVKDGEWHGRGRMGSWGYVWDEKSNDTWRAEVADLEMLMIGDTLLTLVDCHV